MKKCCDCKLILEESKFSIERAYGKERLAARCKKCKNKTKNVKYQKNIPYRILRNLRRRLKSDFNKRGYIKDFTFDEIFGLNAKSLGEYLSPKFSEGMGWHNYGEWEIDHIYPLSLTESKEEYLKYSHHTNIQPMWKYDNIKKRDKIIKNDDPVQLSFFSNC